MLSVSHLAVDRDNVTKAFSQVIRLGQVLAPSLCPASRISALSLIFRRLTFEVFLHSLLFVSSSLIHTLSGTMFSKAQVAALVGALASFSVRINFL